MSRRDLSNIGMGNKAEYDTFPHTRAALVNMRDLALNDQELDAVAAIADKFDAEDQAWIEAGFAMRRAQDGRNVLQHPATLTGKKGTTAHQPVRRDFGIRGMCAALNMTEGEFYQARQRGEIGLPDVVGSYDPRWSVMALDRIVVKRMPADANRITYPLEALQRAKRAEGLMDEGGSHD